MPIAIANGVLRNSVYQPIVGELLAHQISTIIACLLFLLLVYFLWRQELPSLSQRQLLFIGLIWVLLTILFEFAFGHYVIGHSWELLFADYNFFTGRIWLLFLLNSFFAPQTIKIFFL